MVIDVSKWPTSLSRKAEEAYKKSESALEALVGPFRLRKIVNTALKKGMLMPFSVSVNRGEDVARLENGQRIQEVSADPSYTASYPVGFELNAVLGVPIHGMI